MHAHCKRVQNRQWHSLREKAAEDTVLCVEDGQVLVHDSLQLACPAQITPSAPTSSAQDTYRASEGFLPRMQHRRRSRL